MHACQIKMTTMRCFVSTYFQYMWYVIVSTWEYIGICVEDCVSCEFFIIISYIVYYIDI